MTINDSERLGEEGKRGIGGRVGEGGLGVGTEAKALGRIEVKWGREVKTD